jgi:hypothetical protein
VVGGGVNAAQVKVGIDRREQDVCHVERAEGTLVEDRLEFVPVAVPPASGITTDQQ